VERFEEARLLITKERKRISDSVLSNRIKLSIIESDEGVVVRNNNRIFLYGQLNSNKQDRLRKIREQLNGN